MILLGLANLLSAMTDSMATIAQHHKVNLKRLPIVHKHALSPQMQLSLTNGVA